jgi:hypothetical protein
VPRDHAHALGAIGAGGSARPSSNIETIHACVNCPRVKRSGGHLNFERKTFMSRRFVTKRIDHFVTSEVGEPIETWRLSQFILRASAQKRLTGSLREYFDI